MAIWLRMNIRLSNLGGRIKCQKLLLFHDEIFAVGLASDEDHPSQFLFRYVNVHGFFFTIPPTDTLKHLLSDQ